MLFLAYTNAAERMCFVSQKSVYAELYAGVWVKKRRHQNNLFVLFNNIWYMFIFLCLLEFFNNKSYS